MALQNIQKKLNYRYSTILLISVLMFVAVAILGFNIIQDLNNYHTGLFLLLIVGVGVTFVLNVITMGDFRRVVSNVFLMMDNLQQGDFSVRMAAEQGGISADITSDINPILDNLQAMTVAQPYTDALWDSASGGLMLVNPDGVILRSNDKLEVLVAETRENLLGRNVVEYIPALVLRSSEPIEYKGELVSSYGETIPAIIGIKPVLTGRDQASLQGYFCSITDLQHDTEAESQLYKQVDGLMAVLDTINDALIVVDGQSRILLLNVRAKQMFEYPDGHLLNEYLGLILPGWEYGPEPKYDTTPQLSITDGRKKNGEKIPVEISIGTLAWQGKGALVLSLRRRARKKH